jgi:hypothetical protein
MVALEINYTKLDSERAIRRRFQETFNLTAGAAGSLALAAAGLLLWWSNGLGVLSIAILTVAALLPLFAGFCFLAIPLIVSRQFKERTWRYYLQFTDEAVEVSAAGVQARVGWDRYRRVLIDLHSYLLYHSESDYTLLPRSLLNDPASQKELQDLLERRVNRIVRR